VRFNFTTPGIVYKDLYIVSGFFSENREGSAPGDIRAYSIRTGERMWSFHTIPAKGEFGADTWPENARDYVGAANVWAGFSLDEKRGMLFAPTGSPTYDFYGGDRLGQNLFGNSIIALNAETGERIWHYQVVHHDLWDRDLPAQPNLVTVARDGKKIDAVAQITKHGYVYVLNRETGEPIFPIEEVPVPAAVMDGEEAWPTQPIPTKPPPFTRMGMSEDDITNISETAAAIVAEQMKGYRNEGIYMPLGEQTTLIMPGVIGGGEWGGAAYNPNNGMLYVNANEIPYILTMIKLDDSENMTPFREGRNVFARMCASCHGMDRKGSTHMGFTPPLLGLGERMTPKGLEIMILEGRGRMEGFPWMKEYRPEWIEQLQAFLLSDDPELTQEQIANPEKFIYTHMGHKQFVDPEGYPAIKPPWGTLNAIDLNQGTIKWKVPLGEIAELTARGIAQTGTENYGGPVVTAGGVVFIAATSDEKFRAFDQDTGELLWETTLPASGFATPSVYSVNGKQYIAIACGGGKVDRPTSDICQTRRRLPPSNSYIRRKCHEKNNASPSFRCRRCHGRCRSRRFVGQKR
jgi:quinoprotein glucose dehydrogenase